MSASADPDLDGSAGDARARAYVSQRYAIAPKAERGAIRPLR
jgi:hypothetical protein